MAAKKKAAPKIEQIQISPAAQASLDAMAEEKARILRQLRGAGIPQDAIDRAAHDLSAAVLVEEAAKQTATHMDALFAQIPKGGLTAENGFTYASQTRPCIVCGNAVVPGRICAVDGFTAAK